MASKATQIPYSSVSKLVTANKEILLRTPVQKTNILKTYSKNELEHIKTYIYRMYANNDIPTLEVIQHALNEEQFPFPYSTKSLQKLLLHIGFTYKTINKRVIMDSQRLKVWRTKFIRNIRQYRQEVE